MLPIAKGGKKQRNSDGQWGLITRQNEKNVPESWFENMVEKPETQVFYGTPPLHKYVGYAKNKTGRKMGNYS